MNQRQFDRDSDDDDEPGPHPIRRLFDEHKQRSHRSTLNEDPDWCHHCNAWTFHPPEKCPRLQFKA